jgi:energy-coupling factor transporter ATP-binding protein EcfA2
MPSIAINRLSVRYPFQQDEVLQNVSLEIKQREKVLLLGPSGGGKSTLALALSGIIPRSVEAELTGEVLVDGVDPGAAGIGVMCRKVGILFQDSDTQFCMTTVEDEIAFGLENMGLSHAEMESRICSSMALTGISDRRHDGSRELSGGFKQKLGLACLLAMDQELLILDEPTANLDPAATEEMFSLLAQLAAQSDKTLLFIEHKLDSLLAYIERVIVLDDRGRVVADGGPRHIFQYELEKLTTLGVWVPRLCLAARELENQGMVWPMFPLTLAEWEEGMHERGIGLKGSAKSTVAEVLLPIETSLSSSVPPVLEMERVVFNYREKNVLDNVSFTISAGEFVALLGANGTGKSTLVQLIVKLLVPSKGTIRIAGRPIDKLSTRELMRQVGFVFQNPEHQFVRDTVEDELNYGLHILGYAEEQRRIRVDELVHRFELEPYRQQNPFSLSQGQKRRLSVAATLTGEQNLLILDEPTFGQDYTNTAALMVLLQELNREGKTILMVTHDMELVKQYASRVLLLHERKLVFQGCSEMLFAEEDLLRQAGMKRPLTDMLEPWQRAFLEAVQDAGALAEA